jgi:hypothetical protein
MARRVGPADTEQFPQLGGEGERYRVISKATGKGAFNARGYPKTAMKFGAMPDIGHPDVFASALGNFMHSLTHATDRDVQRGLEWYDRAHEAVRKGVRGGGFMSAAADKQLSGAGIVAAVSPGMNWERSNIHAFKELKGIDSEGWDTIMAATHGSGRGEKESRLKAQAVYAGTSVSSAKVSSMQNAGRIIAGEDPEEVLDPRGAPKTFNFMHNIHNPSDARFATIDGRAFDTMTNRVRPWNVGRGISSSTLPSGGTTRYEHSRNVVVAAAASMGWSPAQTQAVSWEHVRHTIEQLGGQREQGPARLGQPYFHPMHGGYAAHDLANYQHLSAKQFGGSDDDDDERD